MMQNEKIMGLVPQQVAVPAGITNGVFVGALPYQVNVQLRVTAAAATLLILPASAGQYAGQTLIGSTLASATLAAISATFAYVIAASGAESLLTINGPAAFYLASTGTATVSLLRGMSSQNSGIVPNP